jgi:hypothetical protein
MVRNMRITLFILTLALTSIVGAQAPPPTVKRISVQGPRPMGDAIRVLEERFGAVINYEDPAYVPDVDTVDVTSPQARALGRRALDPRGGALTFDVAVGVSGKPVDIPGALNALMGEHEARGNAGVFKVLRHGNTFTVAPAFVRGRTGEAVPHASPLDAEITAPTAELSGREAVGWICDTLTRVLGKKVEPGTTPVNLLTQTTVTLNGTRGSARELLLQVIQGMRWKDGRVTLSKRQLAWRLLYGPSDDAYSLNLHIVATQHTKWEGKRRDLFVYVGMQRGSAVSAGRAGDQPQRLPRPCDKR